MRDGEARSHRVSRLDLILMVEREREGKGV
jgi:hypothetical protein